MKMKAKSYKEFMSESGTIKNKKVFLGGTVNSLWRDELIKKLEIDYFNPVVDDWTSECQAEEIKQRELCDYCLYVITPLMLGVFSIAEATDDSNKRPEKTIFCYLTSDSNAKSFEKSQIKSLDQVGKLIKENGGQFLKDLDELADYLNNS